jgi:hypothetical protein
MELKNCPMCKGELNSGLTCLNCKRTWRYDKNFGSWVTIPKQVEILKNPEIGDKVTDVLKIKDS